MSTSLAKEKAALAGDVSKLQKLFAVVKKFFAKEFLWILFVLLFAVPLALIMEYVVKTFASDEDRKVITELLDGKISLFVGCYAVAAAGIYFTRLVVNAMLTITAKKS